MHEARGIAYTMRCRTLTEEKKPFMWFCKVRILRKEQALRAMGKIESHCTLDDLAKIRKNTEMQKTAIFATKDWLRIFYLDSISVHDYDTGTARSSEK